MTTIATTGSGATETVAWELLRVWHMEAMECVIDGPDPATFTRTSYVSVPARWRAFTLRDLAGRIEYLLDAHYRHRWATLRIPGVEDERILPFAFDFEWVARPDMPAAPDASFAPWMYPRARDNQLLNEIARREIDAQLSGARPGIDARCYANAFDVFRVDEDDTWHKVDWSERAAMFAARYESRAAATQSR